MEIVLICWVMSILHFKICMSRLLLAGNTHLMGQTGFDWLCFSMRKAIDALENALIKIQSDDELFLNEEFMLCIDNIITHAQFEICCLKLFCSYKIDPSMLNCMLNPFPSI